MRKRITQMCGTFLVGTCLVGLGSLQGLRALQHDRWPPAMSLLLLAGGLACYIGGLQDWKRVNDERERETPGFEVKRTTGGTRVAPKQESDDLPHPRID